MCVGQMNGGGWDLGDEKEGGSPTDGRELAVKSRGKMSWMRASLESEEAIATAFTCQRQNSKGGMGCGDKGGRARGEGEERGRELTRV